MKYLIIIFFLSSSFANSGKIELEWDHFTTDAYKYTTQLNDYTSLKINHDFNKYIGSFHFNSRFIGEHFLDYSRITYYSLPEIYLSYSYEFDKKIYFNLKSLNIIFGRKVQSWSVADEYWEFGLWNPLNSWNPLHPTSKGLMGTFLSMKSQNWSVDMLVGGLYLPSSYTKAELKDGLISSSSRWFPGVPNKIDILGRGFLDIKYLVKLPFILDIFFQQSYALSFKTWLNKERTIWTKWAYGYKPVNNMFLVTNTRNILELTNMQVSKKITILPVRHTILSSEWGGEYGDFSTILSVGHTFVQEDRKVPEGWEFLHDRGRFTYLSALMKYNFSAKNYLQLSYLDSWFDSIFLGEEAHLGASKVPFIFNQYKILSGLGFDLHMEYLSKGNLKRQLDINYKYSFSNKGGLLFVQAIYYLFPQLYTSLTADILGAENSEQDYFLNKFRANDYFSWRLGYVF